MTSVSPMTSTIRPELFVLLLLLGTGCTSGSRLAIVLSPDATATLRVFGDNPFVQVDNDGPGPVVVSVAPVVGRPEDVRILRGSIARTLRGGGTLRFALGDGTQARVEVSLQGASGFDLRAPGRQP